MDEGRSSSRHVDLKRMAQAQEKKLGFPKCSTWRSRSEHITVRTRLVEPTQEALAGGLQSVGRSNPSISHATLSRLLRSRISRGRVDMSRHIALAASAAIVVLTACGDNRANTDEAAPAATSSNVTTGVAGSNPSSTEPAQTPAQQTDRGGKPGASTPPPR